MCHSSEKRKRHHKINQCRDKQQDSQLLKIPARNGIKILRGIVAVKIGAPNDENDDPTDDPKQTEGFIEKQIFNVVAVF
jgi:hypothetical protein